MTKNSKHSKMLGRAWRETTLRKLDGLNRAETIILKELISRGNARGYCWPRYKTLAKDTAYSVKTVQRAVQGLERKQMIRVRRLVRWDGTKGNYSYAITLPLPVRMCGHSGSAQEGKESVHKEKEINKKGNYGASFRSLEDQLLQYFVKLIDWRRTPELLSLYEIEIWICQQTNPDWRSLRGQLLGAAAMLGNSLSRQGLNLESWAQLLMLLEAPKARVVNEPDSPAPAGERRINEVAEQLDIVADDVRLIRLLSGFRLERKASQVSLSTSSRYSADQLIQTYKSQLRGIAIQQGCELVVMHDDRIVFSTS